MKLVSLDYESFMYKFGIDKNFRETITTLLQCFSCTTKQRKQELKEKKYI